MAILILISTFGMLQNLYCPNRKPIAHRWLFLMAGMLMAYFAYEAYLNLVGPRVDQEAWKNERESLLGSDHIAEPRASLLGFAKNLESRLTGSKRPYQTFRELKKLREVLAHGKLESYAYESKHIGRITFHLNIYKFKGKALHFPLASASGGTKPS